MSRPMKEKELRLAMVFFGGVSLAIYQHGINREILNLVRASRMHHADRTHRGQASAAGRFHAQYPDEPEASTGDLYLEFLETLGRHMSLRVIVDVIAGASAGGINGVALATAIAHDLSLTPITDMWLTEADMLNLLAPEAKARLWSKWYVWPFMRPLLSRLDHEGMLATQADAEMAERVSVFLRSRWFKPPLDGPRMTRFMLDGLAAMSRSGTSSDSLLPTGVKLDLLVTVTDFYGLDRPIFIHDPTVASEREHRRVLRFTADHRRTGHLVSDFDEGNHPSLAFAGRASASFPGAFPPAQIREVDDILAARHAPWPGRNAFLARNFAGYRERGDKPEDAVLVDGSVLDNKPIMACVEAIRSHGAFREVDRRLVFVDPHPGQVQATPSGGVPGFFGTLRGALMDLPRQEPIYNELAALGRYNVQARRLKGAIEDTRPQVAQMIREVTGERLKGRYTSDDVRHWRLSSTGLLAGSPIVYNAWFRSLVFEALDFVVQLIVSACRYAPDSQEGRRVQDVVEAWARQQGVITDHYVMPAQIYENVELPPFANVVLNFGVVYKRRRLNFVLHEINDLYPGVDEGEGCVVASESLDLLKLRIHKNIDELAIYDDIGFLSLPAVAACRALFMDPVRPAIAGGHVGQLTPADLAEISKLIDRLGVECDLARGLDNTDTVLASTLVQNMGAPCRDAILTAYLGYFCWDAILRPAANALSLNEAPIEEILVDRISPEDATTLRRPDGKNVLHGGSFASFGGFLGRSIRENDYLWGRLHAVDRLFDILLSTVPESVRDSFDCQALKKRAFECVLQEESGRLGLSEELIASLRKAVELL